MVIELGRRDDRATVIGHRRNGRVIAGDEGSRIDRLRQRPVEQHLQRLRVLVGDGEIGAAVAVEIASRDAEGRAVGEEPLIVKGSVGLGDHQRDAGVVRRGVGRGDVEVAIAAQIGEGDRGQLVAGEEVIGRRQRRTVPLRLAREQRHPAADVGQEQVRAPVAVEVGRMDQSVGGLGNREGRKPREAARAVPIKELELVVGERDRQVDVPVPVEVRGGDGQGLRLAKEITSRQREAGRAAEIDPDLAGGRDGGPGALAPAVTRSGKPSPLRSATRQAEGASMPSAVVAGRCRSPPVPSPGEAPSSRPGVRVRSARRRRWQRRWRHRRRSRRARCPSEAARSRGSRPDRRCRLRCRGTPAPGAPPSGHRAPARRACHPG